MKVIRRILFLLIALALVFVTFWFGFMQKPAKSLEEEKKVPVEVELVSAGSIEETIELTGWIKANQIVDIASKVAGRVESLSVLSNEGDLVADFYMGSGTTAVVCKELSRRFIGCDINKRAVQIAQERLSLIPNGVGNCDLTALAV